jgi:hypothetical protein
MSSDASTLPLRDSPLAETSATGRRRIVPPAWRAARSGRLAGSPRVRRERALAAAALLTIVLLPAVIVLGGADRPSFISAPSHVGFFPHWLAGPLGGLWPSFTRSPPVIKSLFTGTLVLTYVAYLVALRYVPQLRARWAIATVLAAHLVLLLSPPLALTDIFNYINYGRMGVLHHLNPYTTIPAVEPHNDPSYDLSNWHNLLSPYGPSFTLITYALVPLGIAASLWSMKVLVTLASLATLLLVWKCARLLDRDPVRALVLVGLNPVVLIWGLGGVHNDFITVFFIVLAFYLLLRGGLRGVLAAPRTPPAGAPVVPAPPPAPRRWWPPGLEPLDLGAGVALVAATSLKASAGILIPVVLAGMLRMPRRLLGLIAGMLMAGAVLAAASLAAFGAHLPALGTQGRLVISVSLPNLLGLILGQGGETGTLRALLSIALIGSVCAAAYLAWRWGDTITASGWATVALLVTLAWVLPWYILWVLPLTALSASRKLRFVALALGAYLILTWMPLATAMDSALGFHPSKTPLGELHQRYIKQLLN